MIQKESRVARFSACGGSLCDTFHSAAVRFFILFPTIGNKISYRRKKLFSEKGRMELSMEVLKKRGNTILWFLYACCICICFTKTTAALTKMAGLSVQYYFLFTAALVVFSLLLVYLPLKWIFSRTSWEEQRRRTKWDFILPIVFTAIAVGIRIFYGMSASSFSETESYEAASILAANNLSPLSLNAANFYIWILALLFKAAGTKDTVCIILNLCLQAGTVLLLYPSVRKMAGRIPAITVSLTVSCLPLYVKLCFFAQPQNLVLFLAAFLIFFYSICITGLRSGKNSTKMPVLFLAAGIVTGVFCYLSVQLIAVGILGFFCILFIKIKEGKTRKPACFLTFLLGILAGFALLMFWELFRYGFEGMMEGFGSIYGQLSMNGENTAYEPSIADYASALPVFILGLFYMFGTSGQIENRGRIWMIPLVISVMVELSAGAGLAEQGIRFLFLGVFAGLGVVNLLTAPVKEEESPETAEISSSEEEIQKKEGEKPESVSSETMQPVLIEEPSETFAEMKTKDREAELSFEEKETTKEEAKENSAYDNDEEDDEEIEVILKAEEEERKRKRQKTTLIPNPLPGPKKHTSRKMDYRYEPREDELHFDLEPSEEDDFDLRD